MAMPRSPMISFRLLIAPPETRNAPASLTRDSTLALAKAPLPDREDRFFPAGFAGAAAAGFGGLAGGVGLLLIFQNSLTCGCSYRRVHDPTKAGIYKFYSNYRAL